MTDLRKAAEMAIDAMMSNDVHKRAVAIIELRQALAQPEQEPVAWLHELADGHRHCVTKDESGYVDNFTDTYKTIPLYIAPPKREWVGLTDAEVEAWRGNYDFFDSALVREVEAKLKEKNT